MLSLLLVLLAIPPLPMAAEDAITEISLERTGCFGFCPVDRIVLRSDGSAGYTGSEYVTRKGEYRGQIDREQFETLARLVLEKKFFDLKDRYEVLTTDCPTLITTVKRGEVTKKVINYGNAAPEALQEIEKWLIELMGKFEWKKAG